MSTFTDLLADKTEAQFAAEIDADQRANEVPVSQWRSVVNLGLSLTRLCSEMLSQLWGQSVAIGKSLFLDTALGAGLKLFAKSSYGLDYEQPQTQVARFLLANVSGGARQTFVAGDLEVGLVGSDRLIWTNIDGGTLEPGQTLLLRFEAREAGPAYNVALSYALELKTAYPGVTVTNPASGSSVTIGSGNSALKFWTKLANAEVQIVDPAANNQPLTVSGNLATNTLTISLRTDGGGALQSTAEEVRAALKAAISATGVPQILLDVQNAGDGTGIVQATSGQVPLPYDGSYIERAGANEEPDDRLKTRCRTRLDTLSGGGGDGAPQGAAGTADALRYWALVTPAGYSASPVRDAKTYSNFLSGSISQNDITVALEGYNTLTAAAIAAVTANFANPQKYSLGCDLTVVACSVISQGITGTINYRTTTGVTLLELQALVATKLAELASTLRVQDVLYPSAIIAAIHEASPAIASVSITVPPFPVTPTWQQRIGFIDPSAMTWIAL